MMRRIMAQLHLWTGLLLCLPLVMLGMTGSILVVDGGRPDAATTVQLFRDVTAAKEIESLVREHLSRAQPASPPGAPPPELTRRELEILRLIATG